MGLNFKEVCTLFKSLARAHGIPVDECEVQDGYYFIYVLDSVSKDIATAKLKQFFRTVVYDRHSKPFHIFICVDEVFVHNIKKTRKKVKKDIPFIERELDL